MATRWRWGALYLGILFIATTTADSRRCSLGCFGSSGSLYKFEDGTVYKYQVEGTTVTTLPGVQNDVTKLGITGTAEISSQGQCAFVLKLSNVQVSGPDGKKYDSLGTDCAKPVRFNLNNGVIENNVCTEEDDTGVALNIKRAVISLFQSSVLKEEGSATNYESDVFGTCPTEFRFSKEGSVLSIKKIRNLNRCAHREELSFPFLSSEYNSNSHFQSTPLLGAQYDLEQKIEGGILKSASGEETYDYRPLLSPESGAKVTVSTKITLQGKSQGSLPANVNKGRSLFFETPHARDGVSNANALLKALQDTVSEVEPSIGHTAAKNFLNLVDVLEHATKTDILAVYSQVKNKETAKNLLLDGLLYTGSADSVEAAAELLVSKEIPEANALRWYLDLNFVKHVSRGALKAVVPLLDGDKVPYQAYLGVGALAGKFCREHDCENVQEFKDLLNKLSTPLSSGCKVSSIEQENNVVASLKGLSNVHELTDEVAEKVSQCAADKSVKTRIRVAALDVFHSDAGKEKLQKTAIQIFKDVEEDSEVRLKAYLALIENPCSENADVIKTVLDSEPVNQVGSFVVSHLRNLRASTNPDKESAKAFFGQIITKKKFPLDLRKFSKNYELSYNLEALNLGASIEANRIFSQKSYIPRSVSLNLTTQLFGHSFNFLEVDARTENFDYVLEKYFGPKGYFQSKETNEVLQESHNYRKKLEDKIKQRYSQSMRPKRSINKQQIDFFADKVKLGVDYEDNNIDFDVSLKLFGAEVGWFTYNDNKKEFSMDKLIDKVFDGFDESLDKAKNVDIDFKKARTFMDATINYPTGLGFALKVKSLGSSAVSVKVNGKFDIAALLRDPRSSDINFQVLPSGSLELNTLLAVDADCVEAGVKVSANVYSNSGSDLSVRVLEGYGLDVKVGLPISKQELFSFSSDVVNVVREQGQPQVEAPLKFNVKRQEHGGCFDQLSSFVGLTFCGEMSFPQEGFKAFSPAYGPSKVSLRIEKDEDLTTYHFKAFLKPKDKFKLEILFDTPNSKQNRKVLLLAEETSDPRAYLLKLSTPWKEVSLDATLIDTDKEQSITVKLNNDDAQYLLKAGALLSGDSNRRKYEPLLEYKTPEVKTHHDRLLGRKGGSKGKTQQQSVSISGAVFVDMKPGSPYRKYELKSVSITTARNKYTVDGTVTVDTGLIATDLVGSCDKDTYKLDSKLQHLEGNNYKASIEFVPSSYPDFSFNAKWEFSGDKNKLENKLVLTHGPDLNSETSRLSLSNLFKYKYENIKSFDIITKNTVSYPILGISGKLEAEAKPKSIDIEFEGTYDKNNFEAKLDAKAATKHNLDYDVEFELKALGNSIDLSCKHEVLTEEKSKFTNSLELKPGGKYQLNAIVEHSLQENDFNNHIDAELKLPTEPKVVKLTAGVKNTNKESSVEFVLSGDNKPVVEIKAEVEKTSKPIGLFKVYLPNYLDSSGNFKYDGQKFTGVFDADFPKTGRKVQGKAEGTVTNTNYKGFAEFLWDANKDPSKKIRLETDTDYTKKSIDSKNSLVVNDQTAHVNVKGNLDGTLADGTVDAEAELGLPSGRVITYKVHRVSNLAPGNNQIEGNWELADYESKGAQPRKLTFKLASKNVDPVKLTFDGQADLTYTTPSNKDVVVHVVARKVPHGDDKWLIAGEGSVTGSLVKYPLNAKLDSEVSVHALKGLFLPDHTFAPLQYHLQVSSGSDISLDANGKINEHIISEEFDLKLPSDLPIHSVKLTTNNVLDLFPSEGQNKQIKTNNALQWNGDKFIKANSEISYNDKEASGKLELESHLLPLRTLTGRIFAEEAADEKSGKADLNLGLAWEGKTAELQSKLDFDLHQNTAEFYLKTNVPEKGTFEVDAKVKAYENKQGGIIDVSVKANDKSLKLKQQVELDRDSVTAELDVDSPAGKSHIYLKGIRKGKLHYDVEGKIQCGDSNTEFDVEGNVESPEDFFLKANLDSPKYKINKWQFEIANKPAKTSGKRISFFSKSAEKNYFTGSATYNVKRDDNSMSIEATGVVKAGDETYPLNVKIVAAGHKDDKLGPVNDVSVDLKAGKYKYEYNHKVYSQGFEAKRTFCKDSTCTNAEVIILSDYPAPGAIQRQVSIVLDLSTFFESLEDFTYKHTIKIEAPSFIDDEALIQYGSHKLQRHLYIKESQAGYVLTLPTRVIAAELTYVVPKDRKDSTLKIEGAVWLDKAKQPNEKTSLLIHIDSATARDGGSLSGEARFTAPGLGKDLFVKGRAEMLKEGNKIIDASFEADVFAKKNQKFVADWKVYQNKDDKSSTLKDTFHAYSKGLGWDVVIEGQLVTTKDSFNWKATCTYLDSKKAKKESVAKLEYTNSKIYYLVQIPEGVLSEADYKYSYTKGKININGVTELVGNKYAESLESKTRVKYNVEWTRDQNQESVDLDYGFAAGQVAEFSGSYDKKPFFSLAIALDEINFLKSKYSYNLDVFKELINSVYKEYVCVGKDYVKVFKAVLERVTNDATDFSEDVRKSLPNFKPVVESYTKELKEIKEEIVNNQHVKDASEYLKGILAVPIQQLTVLLDQVSSSLNALIALLNETWQKINESVKQIIPKLSESYTKVTDALLHLFEDTVKCALSILSTILDKVKEHEAEIKELASLISEFSHDIGSLVVKSVLQVRKEVEDFFRVLYDQIVALPAYAMLKEKWEELKKYEIPEQAWSIYTDVVQGLEQGMPTPELQQLVVKASAYIEKLLRRQPVNNVEELEELYKTLIAAIKSILVIVSGSIGEQPHFKPTGFLPLPPFTVWEAPVGAVKFSLLTWLQSTDLPSLADLYYTYRPRLNPLDYIPPYSASGLLVHNTEFFTFDHRHYTFKGTCSYLLAQDFVDGNFSVAVNLEGGKVKSLFISDKENIIEVRSDKTVHVNGAQAEYPLHQGDLHGWRKYHTINFASEAGFLIHCHPSLEVCSFQISGFYFGKTRGLLGTLDNEQYDDFTVPDGNVAKSTSEFANAWKINPSCGDVADSGPHTHTHTEECTKLFTTESPFRKCFLHVNPSVFRDACDHVVAEAQGPEKTVAACKVAASYVGSSRFEDCQLSLPTECGECTIGSNKVQVGDSVSVKTPGKAADVVFVVEQLKENEEVFSSLVVPLVSTMTSDLKEKGITDVKFALIGFGGPNQKWVHHYTTDGNIEFTGKTNNIVFEKKPDDVSSNTWASKLNAIANQINVEIGNTQMVKAMAEAHDFPFRADAVKSIVVVLAKPCQKSVFPVSLQQFRILLNRIQTIRSGIDFNLVTPLEDLSLEGKDAKAAANVVGFDNEAVYTQSEAKRKVLRGDEEAFKSLKYGSDLCVDYVQSVGGAVFSSENFINGKPGVRKNFLQVLSDKVVENLTEEELQKECTCEFKMGLAPVSRCKVVGRKEKEQLRQTKGGVKG